MTGMNNISNLAMFLIIAVVIIGVIYYFNQGFPIPNEGTVATTQPAGKPTASALASLRVSDAQNRAPISASDNVVNDFIKSYTISEPEVTRAGDEFEANDPYASTEGPFGGLPPKKYLNVKKMEQPYVDDEDNANTFIYKKKKFVRRTPEDIEDQYDVRQYLPQQVEDDWFDVAPLESVKKIRGTHLIHPKVHIGVTTVGSSLRNATHDLRGNPPNPKINVSPWNNSTIEPDTNLRPISNPV